MPPRNKPIFAEFFVVGGVVATCKLCGKAIALTGDAMRVHLKNTKRADHGKAYVAAKDKLHGTGREAS